MQIMEMSWLVFLFLFTQLRKYVNSYTCQNIVFVASWKKGWTSASWNKIKSLLLHKAGKWEFTLGCAAQFWKDLLDLFWLFPLFTHLKQEKRAIKTSIHLAHYLDVRDSFCPVFVYFFCQGGEDEISRLGQRFPNQEGARLISLGEQLLRIRAGQVTVVPPRSQAYWSFFQIVTARAQLVLWPSLWQIRIRQLLCADGFDL